ncbi:protein regulator of cytokinesis 1-like isoform X2 [Cylas formicarius]|uniref:protein regulator of cytokinesis 1-like isoform X2 n=1 Tax=Cylas formicarius TaxID=197179 RepID=UPI0029588136|nr:protein regulator of cytokinesis 1-like isoform X2 [Cylas formicarius]
MSEKECSESINCKLSINDLEELDTSMLQDHPWALTLLQNIQDTTQKYFLNWCKIVFKLGLNSDCVKKWSQIYVEQIEGTYSDMLMEIVDLQTKTINKIEHLLCQLEKLCLDLNEKLPPRIGADGLGLFEEQKQLQKKIDEYQSIMEARKKELDDLRNKQLEFCKSLGKEPKIILQYPPLPTQSKIEEFQRHIDQLQLEIFERHERFFKLKEEIIKMVSELNYKPNSDFEQQTLLSDTFLVTKENMQNLEYFHNSLKELLKSTDEEVAHLRLRIEELWRMLEIDMIDQDEFRTHYTGRSLDTLKALRLEVKRCEELRKANLKVFVDKLRDDLKEIWEKCHCSSEERGNFHYLNSDCYTEDLLELHDLEICKWRSYYEENKRLLSLIEKHKELWERVVELEDNATGPDRYKNRGGRLLQEEKERNKLSKMIPKIEEEIAELADNYQSRNNGTEFRTYGSTVQNYISNIHTERENLKKQKLSARKLNRENTMTTCVTPGKSAVNLFPSTSTAITPMSSCKRKILVTPNTDIKKPKLQNTPKTQNSCQKHKIPSIKITYAITSSRQKRQSNEKKRRISGLRRKSRNSLNRAVNKIKTSETTANTTYSEFQCEALAYSSVCSPIEEERPVE